MNLNESLESAMEAVIRHEAECNLPVLESHLLHAAHAADEESLDRLARGWPHLVNAVRMRRAESQARADFWKTAPEHVRAAYTTLERHIRMYYPNRATAHELVPTGSQGYWRSTRPCRGICEGRGTVHYHTYNFHDAQRGGRFTSPYATWRELRDHYAGAWAAAAHAAGVVDMDPETRPGPEEVVA